MSFRPSRRKFFQDVGRGMLVASVGYGLATDLGFSPAWADEEPGDLNFGSLEPLVVLMQDTPADRLQPKLVDKLRSGASLHDLVSAAALANARSFGGEDYVGFHTLMALGPAYSMASLLPEAQQPLPILKVLYRNTNRIQEVGGHAAEALHLVQPAELAAGANGTDQLAAAIHAGDRAKAERILAALTQTSADEAYNALLQTVEEATDVHRIVLAHRSWDMLSIVGMEHAQTMLRQSLRYCVKQEENSQKYQSDLRTLLPKLIDQYKLADFKPGTRQADDAWVDQFSQALFAGTQEQAAESVAAALAEGILPEHVGEAIAVAANQLTLRDAGRTPQQAQPNKPAGSVHGDSVGVHACDTVHAWQGIARTANPRNAAAALVLAGYTVARDRGRGGQFLEWQPRPHSDQLERIGSQDAETLLTQLDGAIREKNQEYACALVHKYGELGYPARPAFDLLLKFGVSEDGALHAEKYFRTTSEEFAAIRPAFRWRQLTALARVTASEFGIPAPGMAEAKALLGVS